MSAVDVIMPIRLWDDCQGQAGHEMLLHNVLNHYSPQHGGRFLLYVAIHHTRIMEFQDTFWTDSSLCALVEMIINGWSEFIDTLQCFLCPCLRDVLIVEGTSIYHGRALMILPRFCYMMLCDLHRGHMGIKKSQSHP